MGGSCFAGQCFPQVLGCVLPAWWAFALPARHRCTASCWLALPCRHSSAPPTPARTAARAPTAWTPTPAPAPLATPAPTARCSRAENFYQEPLHCSAVHGQQQGFNMLAAACLCPLKPVLLCTDPPTVLPPCRPTSMSARLVPARMVAPAPMVLTPTPAPARLGLRAPTARCIGGLACLPPVFCATRLGKG
jgi:hypothetical protein